MAPLDQVEAISSVLWDHRTTGVAELPSDAVDDGTPLVAGFRSRQDAEAAARALTSTSPAVWATPVEVDDDGWIDRARTSSVTVDGRVLTIEVGGAFGAGDHPTTALALAALEVEPLRGRTVLDFGAGTGILTLAAAVLGADAVTAVDVDGEARSTTIANLVRHRAVTGATSITVTDAVRPGLVVDLVVANVVIGIHRRVAGDLTDLLEPGGRLVATGALVSQRHELDRCYHRLRPVASDSEDGWIAVTYERDGDRR